MNQQSNLKLSDFSCHNLTPVSLELSPGETISISGDSGSGKSLLLRAVADLIPYVGHCYLQGEHAKSIEANHWRKQVAYFAAESQWWYDSIGEHFEQPLPKKIQSYLTSIGFDANNDVFNWDVMRCSTGERQRLAIIRLLANFPRVLLLDEPTANLDSENTLKVENIFQAYQQDTQCSIIWVSHDKQQQQRVAQRRFKIKNAALIEVYE